MKSLFFAAAMFLSTLSFADVVDAQEDNQDHLIADDQSPDLYDKPYNLNPIPIKPRSSEPASWKEAYGRLCESIENINTRLDLMQARIRTLEDSDMQAKATSHAE
jgi:hypothetical protein